MALSTNLNRKASQEPESCCLPDSLENSQGPIPAPKINPGKSPHLSHLTKSRMSARLNPPNKYIKIGNLIAVPTGNMVLKRQQLVPRPNNSLMSNLSHQTSFVNSSSPSTLLDKCPLSLSPQCSSIASNASPKNITQASKFSFKSTSETPTDFSI